MAAHGIWMPMYWADYFKDTLDFSTFQHGCYMLLIGAYWERGSPLPDDLPSLARICRTTPDKLARYGNPVLGKFTRSEGLLRHQYIENQILNSNGRLAAARANGRAGGLAKSKLTTITKEKRERRSNRPSVNGADVLPLSPERIEELKDKTDRIMKRGKYEPGY